jgi:hypothetical protein
VTRYPRCEGLLGGIELRLDADVTAALDRASAWRVA